MERQYRFKTSTTPKIQLFSAYTRKETPNHASPLLSFTDPPADGLLDIQHVSYLLPPSLVLLSDRYEGLNLISNSYACVWKQSQQAALLARSIVRRE